MFSQFVRYLFFFISIGILGGMTSRAMASEESFSELIFDESLAEDAALVQWIAEDLLIQAVSNYKSSPDSLRLSDTQGDSLRKASFNFVRSKTFIMAKIKMVLMQYPDVLLFDAFLRVIKMGVVLPWMATHGYLLLVPLVEVVPEGLILTGSYAGFRIWKSHIRLSKAVGIDIKKLKSEVFSSLESIVAELEIGLESTWSSEVHGASDSEEKETSFPKKIGLNLNTTLVHKLMMEGKEFLIPVAQKTETSEGRDGFLQWVTRKDLEEMVEPEIVLSLSKLRLNPYFYQNALLQRIFDDPNRREAFIKNKLFPRLTSWPELLEFYHQSESLITLFQTQIDRQLPRFSVKMNIKELLPWIKGVVWQVTFYPRLLKKLRVYQLRTLKYAMDNNGRMVGAPLLTLKRIREDLFADFNGAMAWIDGGRFQRSRLNICRSVLNH